MHSLVRYRTARPAYLRAVAALGQYKPPLQDVRVNIIRNFPGCFTAQTITPAIERARNFAGQLSTAGLSIFGGTASPATMQKAFNEAAANLEALRIRLSQDGGRQYCNTDPATKDMQNQVLHAVLKPFELASDAAVAGATVQEAEADLISDLTSPSHWIPNLFDPNIGLPSLFPKIPAWVFPVALGLGAIFVFKKYVQPRLPSMPRSQRQPEPQYQYVETPPVIVQAPQQALPPPSPPTLVGHPGTPPATERKRRRKR